MFDLGGWRRRHAVVTNPLRDAFGFLAELGYRRPAVRVQQSRPLEIVAVEFRNPSATRCVTLSVTASTEGRWVGLVYLRNTSEEFDLSPYSYFGVHDWLALHHDTDTGLPHPDDLDPSDTEPARFVSNFADAYRPILAGPLRDVIVGRHWPKIPTGARRT